MLVNIHSHVECLLDLCGGAFETHHQAIDMLLGDGKAVGPGEIDHRLVVLYRGSKLLSELSDAQVVSIIGTVGV